MREEISEPDASKKKTADRPELSAVETMLNQPVEQVVRFLCQTTNTWLRGLIDPWRLGQAAASSDARLAPPFAMLVTMFFLTAVTMRLWRAMVSVPVTENLSLAEDMRVAIGEVSFAHAVFMTFPCVLVVCGGTRLLSLIFRGPPQFQNDQLVRAACYAVGWQAGLVACVALLFVLLQTAGYDPANNLSKEMNTYGNHAAALVMFWGGVILAPALAMRMPPKRWWPVPLSLVLSFIMAGGMLLGSMGALVATSDLSTAARTRIEREYDALLGDLHINLLRVTRIDIDSRDESEQYALSIAYSSRAKQLLIVSQQNELKPPKNAHSNFDDCRLRVVSSSLDDLDDRALILEPGQTRVAHYRVQRVAVENETDTSHKKHKAPYAVAYHRRGLDGFFSEGEAVFWAPGIIRR